jgi:hypothetical protein
MELPIVIAVLAQLAGQATDQVSLNVLMTNASPLLAIPPGMQWAVTIGLLCKIAGV